MVETFEVEIDSLLEQGVCRARAKWRGREAEEHVVLPVYDEDSPERREGEREPRTLATVRELGKTRPSFSRETERDLLLGRELFGAIFQGRIRDLFSACCERAKDSAGLRLGLRLGNSRAMHRYPWELLHDGKVPLALGRDVSLVRFIASSQQDESPKGKEGGQSPLRILVLGASPPGSDSLDLDAEWRQLVAALSGLPGVELERLERATAFCLRRALDRRSIDVVHFMGHGVLNEDGNRALLFEDEAGAGRIVSADRLGEILAGSGVRFVFLNACGSGEMARHGALLESSIAPSLLRAGVSALLAMREPIQDAHGIELARSIYQSLAIHWDVEAAVRAARWQMRERHPDVNVWAIPVIYTHPTTSTAEPEVSIDLPGLVTPYLEKLRDDLRLIRTAGAGEQLGLAPLPLSRIYSCLRVDRSTPRERQRGREALERSALDQAGIAAGRVLSAEDRQRIDLWLQHRALTDATPATLEERDRPQIFRDANAEAKVVALPEALSRANTVVILGDPGSGKTTLLAWIALRMANAWLSGQGRLEVDALEVDPEASEACSIDLGPTQIPILVRAATLDQALLLRPTTRLEAHLADVLAGAHRPDAGSMIEPRIREALAGGRVLLLLDGLDEVAELERRRELTRLVEQFIGRWVGRGASGGGNRLVVSSRILGYLIAPLEQAELQLTLEPMSPRSAEQFCRDWCAAQPLETARGLEQALADLVRGVGRTIASNPQLLSTLALIQARGEDRTPRNRAELFQAATKTLFAPRETLAVSSPAHTAYREALGRALEDLALELQQRSGLGLIGRSELQAFLSKKLAVPAGAAVERDSLGEVGLLSARGEGMYGFLHLSFQEYLAACALVRQPEQFRDELRARMTAPRWREPLLLALGKLSLDEPRERYEALLLDLLRQPDPLGMGVPRGALLFVASLPDLAEIPASAIETAAGALLRAYAGRELLLRFPLLKGQVRSAFSRLLAHGDATRRQLERFLLAALADARPEGRPLLLATADLLASIGFFTPDLARALTAAEAQDGILRCWPIDRALQKLAAQAPAVLETLELPLRRSAIADPVLGQRLTSDGWLRVALALYGGVDCERLVRAEDLRRRRELLRRSLDLLHFQPESAERLAHQAAAEEEWRRTDSQWWQVCKEPWFSPRWFDREPPGVGALVLEHLRRGAPAADLINPLHALRSRGATAVERRDAIHGLLALGEPVTASLSGSDPHSSFARDSLDRLGRRLEPLLGLLAEPALRALAQGASSVDGLTWLWAFDGVLELLVAFKAPLPDLMPIALLAPKEAKPFLLADELQRIFSDPDPATAAAIFLHHHSSTLQAEPTWLARGLAYGHLGALARQQDRAGWGADLWSLRPVFDDDFLPCALEGLAAIPVPSFQGWALRVLQPLLGSSGAFWEGMILAATLPDESRRDAIEALVKPEYLETWNQGGERTVLRLCEIATQLNEPLERFRCLRRLVLAFPHLRARLLGDGAGPERAIAASARGITSSRLRAWACEQLAILSYGEPRAQWFREARAAAETVLRADLRALALGRLVGRLPRQPDAPRARDAAIAAVREISTSALRGWHYGVLRRWWAHDRDSIAALDAALAPIRDAGERARARNLLLPALEAGAPLLRDSSGALEVLRLAASILDQESQLGPLYGVSAAWSALLTPHRREGAAALRHNARKHCLRLTAQAVSLFDELLGGVSPSLGAELLSIVDRPRTDLLPMLQGWARTHDPTLRRQIHLLMAEAEGPTTQTLASLIELLSADDDRVRYRAMVALHGDKSPRQIPLLASRLGRRAIELLAHESERYTRQPQVALTLQWCLNRIHHDDAEAVHSWLDLVARGGDGAAALSSLLFSICDVSSAVLEVLLRWLDGSAPHMQADLLRYLANLFYLGKLPLPAASELLTLARRLASTSVGDIAFLADPETAVCEVAVALVPAAVDPFGHKLAVAAIEMLLARRSPLRFVADQPDDTVAGWLHDLGGSSFDSNLVRERIIRSAERLEKEADVFERLLVWLARQLEKSVNDSDPLCPTLRALLCVAAAGAERMPTVFRERAARLPGLERNLCRAVEHHASFPGRQAALILLSFIGRVSTESLAALRLALRDNVRVQMVVFACIDRFRSLDEAVLPRLFADLHDPSPAAAYTTIELLVRLAQNVHLPTEMRDRIVTQLAKAAEASSSEREVYQLTQEQNGEYTITHRGQLGELIYQRVAELWGLADLDAGTEGAL